MPRPLLCCLILAGCVSESNPSAPAPPTDDVAVAPELPGAPQCVPGVRQAVCASPTSVTRCTDDGSGWEEAACPAGERCYQGRCVDYPCPPGAIQCTGPKTVSACLAVETGGFGWRLMETCGGLCQEGACVPQCDFLVKQNLGKACDHFVATMPTSSTPPCPRST